MICINQVQWIKTANNNDRPTGKLHYNNCYSLVSLSLFPRLSFTSCQARLLRRKRAESVFALEGWSALCEKWGWGGGGRGGREANRKAPSVSVTGALLTGNFFRGQVVPSRHATNQAGQAAGSDYKKGRDCADMFIRSHKLRWYAYTRGVRTRPGGKGARNNTESLHFFPSSCAVSRPRGRRKKEKTFMKRFTFAATKCVELRDTYGNYTQFLARFAGAKWDKDTNRGDVSILIVIFESVTHATEWMRSSLVENNRGSYINFLLIACKCFFYAGRPIVVAAFHYR